MSTWQDAYARVGLRFGVVDLEHPGGHHGQDFPLPNGGGSPEYAYEECTVVECGVEVTRGFTSIMGWYLVARAKSDGAYLGWAHLRRGTRPAVGTVLKPGDIVGLAAAGPRPQKGLGPDVAGKDYPGTAWTAPHVHTTRSTTITGIFAGPTFDPLPRIQAALAGLAGTGTTKPVVVPKPAPVPKEWDEMATKDEIRQVVQEVIGNKPGNCVVSYASPTDPERNGIVLASLGGHWHKLTGEEKVHVFDAFPKAFAGLPTIVPESDRQYDLVKSVFTNGD